MFEERTTRRDIIKKAAYITPIILTMSANFSIASAGSGDGLNSEKENKKDKKDKGQKGQVAFRHSNRMRSIHFVINEPYRVVRFWL